jgi:hypothetical protein
MLESGDMQPSQMLSWVSIGVVSAIIQDHNIVTALFLAHKRVSRRGWKTSSNIGRDKSFVYDLNKERGIVRMRVAFVPRSAEIKPPFWRFVNKHSLFTLFFLLSFFFFLVEYSLRGSSCTSFFFFFLDSLRYEWSLRLKLAWVPFSFWKRLSKKNTKKLSLQVPVSSRRDTLIGSGWATDGFFFDQQWGLHYQKTQVKRSVDHDYFWNSLSFGLSRFCKKKSKKLY